jgi:hypothetical protein
MGGRRLIASVTVAFAGLLAMAPAAQASFHLIKVREVFPGTAAHPDSDYVVLQMYSSGQNLVQFGQLEVLSASGAVVGTPFTPGSSVANSANQSTVLIANSDYASQLPSGPTPDFTDSGLTLDPAGGAVCWPQTEPPYDDCASWGDFTGQAMLASTDSAPASPAGIPDGMAIRRSIAPGCSTLLEDADDTDNSSVDFSPQTPNPRSNATAPTETPCTAPDTSITSSTPSASRTNSTDISFTFTATPSAGATFECKLDSEPSFTSCSSPASYSGLSGGAGTSHTFQVRAVNATTGTDSTPATHTWTIDTVAPTATIDTKPSDPSAGTSASFSFHSSEVGSTFQCSLTSGAPDSFSACSSGKTYTNLANGAYTFKVRATDSAGNQGTAAIYDWTVDNSLADTTPPVTTIDTKPPDPSDSSTASFTYHANEPSTFECRLDGAPFAACPAEGITYAGLQNGSHSFQVRATDTSPQRNAETNPPGYTFTVALPAPPGMEPPPVLPSNPDTILRGRPPKKTHDRTPTFRFASDRGGASFQCKLDRGRFRSCRSPFTTGALSPGRHRLLIRARVGAAVDPTPAAIVFRVLKKRRHHLRKRR